MSKVLVSDSYLSAIGNVIRSKTGSSDTYTPAEMASAINSIVTYPEPTGTKSITSNGSNIDVKDYASANVNVPNSYSAGDEGKVVDNGTLVTQGSQTITQNGTYDTTLIGELIANIAGGGGGGGSTNILSGTSAPTSSQGSDGDLYLEYNEEVCIHSDGNAIVSSAPSIMVNVGNTFECKFRLNSVSANREFLFGGVNSFISNTGWYGISFEGGHLRAYQSQSGSSSYQYIETSVSLSDLMDGDFHVVKLEGAKIYLDDVLLDTFNFTPNFSIYLDLFGVYRSNYTDDSMYQCTDTDIAYLKMTDTSDNLVYNLLPYNNNGSITFKDSINDTLWNDYGQTQNLTLHGEDEIIKSYLKVNGAWQQLIGSDIDDVNTGGVAPEADDWSALDTYIESSGTQYIDIGYDITSDTKIECVCNISNANTYPAPFGTRVGYHNNELYVMYRTNNTNTTSFAWANNNRDATVGLDFGGNVNEKVEITASKEGLRILTENIYKSITFLVSSPSAPINDNPLFVFGMNDGGVIDSNTKCTMKLYCFRIYEGDTLVHEFIPWIDSNEVVCLKDTVTGNLKYNAGTGTFTYGTDS